MSPNRKEASEAPATPPLHRDPDSRQRPSPKRKKSPAKTPVAASQDEEVRREKMIRAKRLLQDANYPSDEVIESVANLLARGWSKSQSATSGASIENRDPGTN